MQGTGGEHRAGGEKGGEKEERGKKNPSHSGRAGSAERSVLMVVFGLSQPFPSICQSCERETLKAKGWQEEEDEELEERRRGEEIHGKSFERAVNKGCVAEPVPG